jgi:acetyl-CoA carboxylase carboxyltransferase component
MSADDRIDGLRRLKAEARQSDGPELAAARRREECKSARERLLDLLDPGTFVELDVLVEGVVTGHGKVGGRDVYVFSQDGSGGEGFSRERRAAKTVKVVDLAMKNGAPLVGIYDEGRRREREGISALGNHADLFFRNVMASGVVPQIAAIMGPCAAAAAFSPLLADFTLMVKGTSHLLLTGPDKAHAVLGESATIEGLGGARLHDESTGAIHLAADDEAACLAAVRRLLSFLPQNNLEETPRLRTDDPAGRPAEALDSLMPLVSGGAGAEAAGGYDMRDVVRHVVDGGDFLELMPRWAPNLVIGFARLDGRAVGVVGNNPRFLGGHIDLDAADKGARFVRTCDVFNLPLLTFVDTPGFQPGLAQARAGAVRRAAKLLYSYCEATVPKLTVITGRAYGEAYEVMCSKHIRADFNLAWPSAEIAATAGAAAVRGWEASSPVVAARRGLLDDVIEPRETRARLAAALDACASKREGRPPKKHGNMPV